ncbi:MAG: histidine kinase, partial [Anaerolineales bacterium]
SIVVAGPLLFLEPYWPGVREFGYSVVQASLFAPFLMAFLSIFPNGRFVPSWTRGVVVVSILYGIVSPFFFTLGADSTLTTSIGVFVWFALFFSGLYAQFSRYRHISNPVERQQTKWVVYGFSLELLLAILLSALTLGLLRMPADIPLPWLTPFVHLGWSLAFALLPISLTIAVMRYRLYDIDLLINRTLVYGVLTGCVIVVYALTVGAFGVLFQSGGNLLVALVATGLVAVLFQPLRVRLQKGVNHLMYGERDEPFTVLRHLGERLEGSGMPEETLAAIVETVVQALKLPYAEITLRRGEKFERAALYGKHVEGMVSFPIQYQGQIVGYLNAGVRGPRESLTGMDEQLLRQIAQQAGPVAQAVQLTRDLRRSRARLITAREEERRRLRRDLHDGLGPVLASQGLKIAAVHHLLDSDPESAQKLLNEMAAQNETTVAEIRRLVYALRPPELDELGLARAIREYTNGLNVSKDSGTSFEVSIQPPGEELKQLPAAVEVAAYRIATEALTNVTRHAHARYCTISFKLGGSSNGRELLLEIADDGIGFEENGKAGIGLNSMHERAEEVGGELQIESVVDQGTRVSAAFPLAE